MTPFQSHGRVIAGTVTVPSLDAALTVYRDLFGLIEVERGPVPADLVASWGCPANAGAPSALLQPASGAPCFIRLVEQQMPDAFVPTTSYGWASYEISVQQVFDWAERIAAATDAGITIVGPPREIPSLPFFVAMQMHGPGKEMLYFNEVRMDTPTTDLPKAASPVDHIFITILAAHDRAASVAWYRDIIGLDEADSYTLNYTMINKAFGLPNGTQSSLTMMQAGRMPIFEIDDYPPEATPRPHDPGHLPPGNALVTMAVRSFDGLEVEWITSPVTREGALYAGRRTGTVRGPSEELLELVEVG
jgi:catechol 2,3-dioxygenase-like lactoylglutathione lyase family enzyme